MISFSPQERRENETVGRRRFLPKGEDLTTAINIQSQFILKIVSFLENWCFKS
jgi:hypothetical protein